MAGDRGNDTVTGGAGADTFYVFAGSAIDRVTDFSSASGDRVMLDKGQAYTLSYTSEGAVIDLGNGDQMILVGVTSSTLGDWLLA
jgi:Ca2+-binding RTX toxin-like protein